MKLPIYYCRQRILKVKVMQQSHSASPSFYDQTHFEMLHFYFPQIDFHSIKETNVNLFTLEKMKNNQEKKEKGNWDPS